MSTIHQKSSTLVLTLYLREGIEPVGISRQASRDRRNLAYLSPIVTSRIVHIPDARKLFEDLGKYVLKSLDRLPSVLYIMDIRQTDEGRTKCNGYNGQTNGEKPTT